MEFASELGFFGLGKIDRFACDWIVQFLFQRWAVVEKNPIQVPASPVNAISVGKVGDRPAPCDFGRTLRIEGVVGFDGTETMDEERSVNQDGSRHGSCLEAETKTPKGSARQG